MKTQQSIFIILALLLVQCSRKPEKISFFENFRMKNIIVVNKKQELHYVPINSIQYRPEANDTIFSYFNETLTSIIFNGIGNSNFSDTIQLHDIFAKYEIENYLGHLYENDNLVFILVNKMNYELMRLDYFVFQMDMNANILQLWDIAHITGINETHFYLKTTHNPMLYINGNLIIGANILHNPKEKKDVSKTPTELILNTKTNKAHFVYGRPEIYGNGKYYGNHAYNHSKAFINDTVFVISFPIDHYLYKFHINGSLIKKSKCKSDFIDEFKYFEWSENMGIEKIIEIQVTQPYYYQITYDSQNKLIYRLVLHEQEALTSSGEKASFFDRSFSLMVIDENLQIVGEYYIPPYHLCPWMINTNLKGGPFIFLDTSNPSLLCIAEYEYFPFKTDEQ